MKNMSKWSEKIDNGFAKDKPMTEVLKETYAEGYLVAISRMAKNVAIWNNTSNKRIPYVAIDKITQQMLEELESDTE